MNRKRTVTYISTLLLLLVIVIISCHPEDDTDLPYIFLLGDNPMYVDSIGGSFTEPGYTAVDDVDGDLTANVIIEYPAVQADSAKSYSVKYSVTDKSGNTFSTFRTFAVRNTAAFMEGYFPNCTEVCTDTVSDSLFTAVIIASVTQNDQFIIRNFGNIGGLVDVQCSIDRYTGKITIPTPQLLSDSTTILSVLADSNYVISRTSPVKFQLYYTYQKDTITQDCSTFYSQ